MATALLTETALGTTTALGPFRLADYDALPESPRTELIYGSLYVSPSPSPLHQIVLGSLFEHLRAIARSTRGVALLAPLDVAFAEHTVVQPDILYYSPERRPRLDQRITSPPDLVIEVLSPGSHRRDRGDKLRVYAEFGVREYWLVDPLEKQITFLTRYENTFAVALPVGTIYRSSLLHEVELDLAVLWEEVSEQMT